MYKFIVSCYYWPAGERSLRLRTLTIKTDATGKGLEHFPISKLTRLDHLTSSIERREMRRLKVRCEVELLADLSLLDTDAGEPLESLAARSKQAKDVQLQRHRSDPAARLPGRAVAVRQARDGARRRDGHGPGRRHHHRVPQRAPRAGFGSGLRTASRPCL